MPRVLHVFAVASSLGDSLLYKRYWIYSLDIECFFLNACSFHFFSLQTLQGHMWQSTKNPNRAVFRVQKKFRSKSSSRNYCFIDPLPRALGCSRQPLKGQFPLEEKALEALAVFLLGCVFLKQMYRLSRYPGNTGAGNHRQCHSQSNFRSEVPQPNLLSSQENSKRFCQTLLAVPLPDQANILDLTSWGWVWGLNRKKSLQLCIYINRSSFRGGVHKSIPFYSHNRPAVRVKISVRAFTLFQP